MGIDRHVVIATGNPGKLAEWRVLLEGAGFVAEPWGGEMPDEDAPDYVGNAALKAVAAARGGAHPAIGDDVGIAIDALYGAPGLFTRRWAEERGGFAAARREVVRTALGSRAIYRCGLAWAEPAGRVVTALGEVEGRIVEPDHAGVGFEPCFEPDGVTGSLSALSDGDRSRYHHRARAWAALQVALTAT